jgi:hypothetical protein
MGCSSLLISKKRRIFFCNAEVYKLIIYRGEIADELKEMAESLGLAHLPNYP